LGIKDKLQNETDMMTAISIADLRVLMHSVYYVAKLQETVQMYPQNYNGFYIQSMSIAFLNANVMN
jgi:hypothetical protein